MPSHEKKVSDFGKDNLYMFLSFSSWQSSDDWKNWLTIIVTFTESLKMETAGKESTTFKSGGNYAKRHTTTTALLHLPMALC